IPSGCATAFALRSWRLHTPGVEKNRIERGRASDKKAILCWSTECYVRDHMRHKDFSKYFSTRTEAMDPIACARPDIPVFVHAETVGKSWLDLVKYVSALERRAILFDLENSDILFWIIGVRGTCFRDIEQVLIWRECQTIRAIEIIRNNADFAAFWFEAINGRRLLRLFPAAFVIVHNPIKIGRASCRERVES